MDHGDKLTSITPGGSTIKSYGYDAAGRTTSVVTSAGKTSLSYDYEDRVTGITYPTSATNSFSYNGLDTRVSKVDSTGTSTYLRDGARMRNPRRQPQGVERDDFRQSQLHRNEHPTG